MTRNELKAFEEGYDCALFKGDVLDHKKEYEAAWVRGYKRGKEAVEFHKRLLTRRSTFDWFNNLSKRTDSIF